MYNIGGKSFNISNTVLFLYEVRTRQGMFETLRAILDYMKPITSYLILRPNVWLIANLDKIKDFSKPANVSHLLEKRLSGKNRISNASFFFLASALIAIKKIVLL